MEERATLVPSYLHALSEHCRNSYLAMSNRTAITESTDNAYTSKALQEMSYILDTISFNCSLDQRARSLDPVHLTYFAEIRVQAHFTNV